MSMTAAQLVEFPVGYAELANHDDNTVFYVEWLDNNSEFPDLTNINKQSNDGSWELLERKELENESFTLVEDEDNWSKINAFSYVQVAEKNANQLKPITRTVQPLWPIISVKKEQPDANNLEEEDDGFFVYDVHKSQSRLANRSTESRRIHNLRILDSQLPYQLKPNTSTTQEMPFDDNKAEVLKFCSKANLAKYKYTYSHGTKNHKKDYSEYSVLDSLKKR